MTEETLNEGKELWATIEDLEERKSLLSYYSELEVSDTYLLFDEHVKVHVPERVAMSVVELIRKSIDDDIATFLKEFSVL